MANTVNESAIKKLKLLFTVVDRPKAEFYLDVLSELDPKRQEFVLNRISGGQVFITCCEDDRLTELLNGKVFHVKHGTVE